MFSENSVPTELTTLLLLFRIISSYKSFPDFKAFKCGKSNYNFVRYYFYEIIISLLRKLNHFKVSNFQKLLGSLYSYIESQYSLEKWSMYSALTDHSGDSISWQPMTKLVLSISLAIQILPSPAQSQIGIMRIQIRQTLPWN